MALRQPKSIAEWLALPVLPHGEHRLFNVGVTFQVLAECRRRSVEDLPPPMDDEDDAMTPLPNVEVLQSGEPVMFRLSPMFGSFARQIHADAGAAYARGLRILPELFRFGRNADGTAFAFPVDPSN